MKTALVVMLAVILGLGAVSFTLAQTSPKLTEGQSGSMMGHGMMGGGQMGQMMPMMEMMQACTKMMQQMSAMMGQHDTPQQQPPQPEKK
mgnify:CR=1 FL=1